MLEKLFLQILNMSFIGGIVILFILTARIILKKAPKIFSYSLWAVALLRLIFPFSFESILSLIPIKTETISQDILYNQTVQVNSGVAGIDNFTNSSLPAGTIYERANSMEILVSVGSILWVAGILVLLTYSLVSLFRLKRRLENEVVYEKDNIYSSTVIDTPFVLGIIHPKIYLPTLLSESEKNYILLHEQTHIKRFDHVMRVISYLVLCIHWFNPLVWIAFYVSGKDMEMACDESVIRRLGDGVKKDYSSSLLSLATGKRRLGATPLAFSEGDTKGRIKNIMNYKKPMFWVILIILIGIVIFSFSLLSNPKQAGLTVEDYAKQYVQQVVEDYEKAEYQNFEVVERKITSLNKLAAFDNIRNQSIELWSIEYRLKPDNIQNVLFAGGMNESDGWITEDSSMGKPIMIFSYEKKKPKYLGVMWSGEMGSTLSGQEVAVRRFLESSEYLPKEFFVGKHAIVKVQFRLGTDDISQVLLSQPATQGDKGIWCVERWMDGNNIVYYNDPQVDSSLVDYYKELQKQCDDGQNLWRLDPSQVALEFINQTLGQSASRETITLISNASVDDFSEIAKLRFLGFISNFAESNPDLFHFDPINWITLGDKKRMEELGISSSDMPNGYYIDNPVVETLPFEVNEKTEYNFIDWGNNFVSEDEDRRYSTTNKEDFIRYLNTYSDKAAKVPFWIEVNGRYVERITEKLVN